jgi:protein-S-isoprenylcysteine O-methyltransferase Ste14
LKQAGATQNRNALLLAITMSRRSSMTEISQSPGTDRPGVIAPPPLIYLGVLVLALLHAWLVGAPGFGLPFWGRMALGAIFALGGLAPILAAGKRFTEAGTNIQPWKPSTALVTTGVYRYSRNPIYLGMALIYVGLSLFADSLLALAWLPLALIIIHLGVIRREERYLEAKFGEEYRAYRGRVRRWI